MGPGDVEIDVDAKAGGRGSWRYDEESINV
jgi:hypothetical protein